MSLAIPPALGRPIFAEVNAASSSEVPVLWKVGFGDRVPFAHELRKSFLRLGSVQRNVAFLFLL